MHLHNEDRILDFLDGRLSGESEEELLHTLAVSPERRQMLRDHLKLRELTHNLSRQQQFSVPEHVTNGLFTQLGALGFSAPVSTSAILNNAPALVKAAREEEHALAVASRNRFFGRFTMTSLVTASMVSFFLGIGAFYVFGSNLGLKTISEQESEARIESATHRLVERTLASTVHEQFAQAVVAPELTAAPVRLARSSSHAPNLSVTAARAVDVGESIPTEARSENPVIQTPSATAEEPSIAMAAPRESERPLLATTRTAAIGLQPYLLPGHLSPFLNEKGTISFRFGSGRAPKNTTQSWTSLSELKFSWTLWDYIVARASLGQFISYQLEAQNPKSLLGDKVELTTAVSPNAKFTPVIGAELGVMFDNLPLHAPLEISAGFMADGSGTLYKRAGIFGHYEIFDALNLGVGIEAMLFSHDVTSDLNTKRATYNDFGATIRPGTVTHETAGFVGPSVEIGWRF